MNSQHVRIFLTPSQICTVYATMLAKETHQENDVDILFMDASKRRKGLIELISKTSKIYDWSLFHDFSIPMGEEHDYNPTVRKNITRKFKNWPVVRNIYSFLLKRHFRGIDERYRHELMEVLKPFLNENTKISLFMLTQTYLNQPLMQLFPKANINYIEHGMGDYYYVLDPQTPKGNFYCLFAKNYSQFLQKKGNSTDWVYQLQGIESFPQIAQQLLSTKDQKLINERIKIPNKRVVFILLEAVDMYNVKQSFWSEYLDHIFSKLSSPDQFHYLLKPHPMQSEVSIVATKNHLDKLGYSYSILNETSLINASAEVLFSMWKNQTDHVFCLFSSGCYYLSKLYASEKITFWYSTEFLSNYISNAPPQFTKLFVEIRPLIEEVLTENCQAY